MSPPVRVSQAAPPGAGTSGTSGVAGTSGNISPYIASTESFHPFIQYELIKRSKSSEMATVYMPFAKLTSLSNVLGDNLLIGDRCSIGDVAFPSLGIHGEKEVSFEDIYLPNKENRSIVAYGTAPVTRTIELATGETTELTLPGRVPVLVTREDAEKDPPNIPMPGIINIQTERATAGPMGVRGGLFRATVNIKAYSTGQVNTLLRYFLRPATRVILELGHQSSTSGNEEILKSIKETSIYQKFDWNRTKQEINKELEDMVRLKKSQKDFIEKYIYGNFGNYEIMIGYVVDFKLNFNKDNSYAITLTLHSLQQYEVPTSNTGVQSLNQGSAVPNKCLAVEINDYFNPASGWRENSFAKLIKEASANTSKENNPFEIAPLTGDNWKQHIIPLRGPGSSPGSGGNEQPGYLVSWQFFVDVILNDIKYGILSVFQQAAGANTEGYIRSAVIRNIGKFKIQGLNQYGEIVEEPTISLNSNEVGWSPALRSIDPNIMVIYNPLKDDESKKLSIQIASKLERMGRLGEEEAQELEKAFAESSVVKTAIKSAPIGKFEQVNTGTSYLTKGVWINTNAIIQAFQSGDTISVCIDNLLKGMNNATKGFWNLQLLSNDSENPGMHVVDMGVSKEVNKPIPLANNEIFKENILENTNDINKIATDVSKLGTLDKNRWTPKYLYLFNRGLGTNGEHDNGSELLDIKLESSLPQVIAVQAIAGVGGPMQRGTLQAIDLNELRRITMFDVYPTCEPASSAICKESGNSGPPRPAGLSTGLAQRLQNLIANGVSTAGERVSVKIQKTVDEYVGVCNFEDTTRQEQCERAAEIRRERVDEYVQQLQTIQLQQLGSTAVGYLDMVEKYGSMFGSVLDLIEYDITSMMSELDKDSTEQKVHAFNSSNLTKTIVDLTLPGIGGIQLFQAFAVDRVPYILDRGYYVVTKIEHDFSSENGWTTKLQGRFRFNPNLKDRSNVEPCKDDKLCQESTT